MQQFVVPQFIDREDKILGPITVRQFLIVLAVVIINAVAWKLADFTGFVLSVIFFGGGGVVLAFVKVNGRPFHYFILNVAQILIRPAVRVWRMETEVQRQLEKKVQAETKNPIQVIKQKEVSSRRLSELSLLVDTGGQYRPAEDLLKRQ